MALTTYTPKQIREKLRLETGKLPSEQLTFYRSEQYNRTLDRLLTKDTDMSPASAKQMIRDHGVFIVREGIARSEAELVRRYLAQFDKDRHENGHPTLLKADPYALVAWEAELNGHYFMASLLRMIIDSPLYTWMAAIADAEEIAIPLSHMNLRGVTDTVPFDFFALHQDYHVVNSAVPFNIWLALEKVIPGEKAGLGFWASAMSKTPKREKLIAFCSERAESLWFPSYLPGDVAFFTHRTPHMTTAYGTGIQRWSAELRYMPAAAIPFRMRREPFVIVHGKHRGFDLGRITFRNVRPELKAYIITSQCQLPSLAK